MNWTDQTLIETLETAGYLVIPETRHYTDNNDREVKEQHSGIYKDSLWLHPWHGTKDGEIQTDNRNKRYKTIKPLLAILEKQYDFHRRARLAGTLYRELKESFKPVLQKVAVLFRAPKDEVSIDTLFESALFSYHHLYCDTTLRYVDKRMTRTAKEYRELADKLEELENLWLSFLRENEGKLTQFRQIKEGVPESWL